MRDCSHRVAVSTRLVQQGKASFWPSRRASVLYGVSNNRKTLSRRPHRLGPQEPSLQTAHRGRPSWQGHPVIYMINMQGHAAKSTKNITTRTRLVSRDAIASSPFETWLFPSPNFFVESDGLAFAAFAGQWTAEDDSCAANTKNLDVCCISTPIHALC